MAEVIWEPSPEVLERANVVRFMRRHGFDDYWEFQQRSQDDPDWFWPAAIEDMGLEFATPWERVSDLSRGAEWATWFVGGTLNIAWNCVHRWAERRPDDVAAVFAGEDGERRELTFAAMSGEVTRLAEADCGDAIGIALGPAMDAVPGDRERRADEPRRPLRAAREVHDLAPGCREVEPHVLDRRGPEPLGILLRAAHELPVVLESVPAHEPRDVGAGERARVGAPDDVSHARPVYEPPGGLLA